MNERLAELAIGLRSLWKARVHVMRCRKTGVFALNVGDVPSEENIESSRCIDGCELASASCFSSHDFKLLETIVETQPQEGDRTFGVVATHWQGPTGKLFDACLFRGVL